jgi:hypothetical protein
LKKKARNLRDYRCSALLIVKAGGTCSYHWGLKGLTKLQLGLRNLTQKIKKKALRLPRDRDILFYTPGRTGARSVPYGHLLVKPAVDTNGSCRVFGDANDPSTAVAATVCSIYSTTQLDHIK